jgi:hypothetical protein
MEPSARALTIDAPRLIADVRQAVLTGYQDVYCRGVHTWDPNKAEANLRKHGVEFRDGATVFQDPLSTTFPSEDHSAIERRFLTIGTAATSSYLLVVAHTEEEETIRIISARRATRQETEFYEEKE